MDAVLLDTHVVIDVLLPREPFAASSDAVVRQVIEQRITGYLCANSFSTIDCLNRVIAASAIASGVDIVITRNAKDFKGSGLMLYSPAEWLAAYRSATLKNQTY